MAAKLHRVDLLPQSDDLARVLADQEIAQEAVDDVSDGTRGATVMRLAIADQPAFGPHPNEHRVATQDLADPENGAVLDGNRESSSLHIDDLHVCLEGLHQIRL